MMKSVLTYLTDIRLILPAVIYLPFSVSCSQSHAVAIFVERLASLNITLIWLPVSVRIGNACYMHKDKHGVQVVATLSVIDRLNCDKPVVKGGETL